MGSVFNRGTRDKPRWIVKWRDIDGRWKQAVAKTAITRADATKAMKHRESNVDRGRMGIDPRPDKPPPLLRELLGQFAAQLDNRTAAGDRYRIDKHLLPRWGKATVASVDVHAVMRWIDWMKVEGAKLDALKAEGKSHYRGSHKYTERLNVKLLSRFFSWCIKQGHASENPVLKVPVGQRPRLPRKPKPVLESDDLALAIFCALPEPLNLKFYIGWASGARAGEVEGLRLGDLKEIHLGRVWYRHSGVKVNTPLKEDQFDDGKEKDAPIPEEEAPRLLEPWLARRRAEGAGPDDLLFPGGSDNARAQDRSDAMKLLRDKFELPREMYWELMIRHTFTTRKDEAGEPRERISQAHGHSDTRTTERYYLQRRRKQWSEVMRKPMGLFADDPPPASSAPVIPIDSAPPRRASKARR